MANENANNTGNVGIGTTDPTEKLHVFGKGLFEDGNGNGVTVGFNSPNSFIESKGIGGLKINNQSDKDVVIGKTDASNFTVWSNTTIQHNATLATGQDDNVIIGPATAIPAAKLNVIVTDANRPAGCICLQNPITRFFWQITLLQRAGELDQVIINR
ncbi:MAG: hypothetical protein HY841_14835 [Bacteroidetes bacterium]|nr:hypothetical protein [Bacteroidota bacterium]